MGIATWWRSRKRLVAERELAQWERESAKDYARLLKDTSGAKRDRLLHRMLLTRAHERRIVRERLGLVDAQGRDLP